ncbi:MAG: ion channel [Deltaproteobacteria bacterium]|nr:ion channel [Deltaproteobacteria bacterium]
MWQFFYFKILRKLTWADFFDRFKLVIALLVMVVIFTVVFYKYEEGVTLWDSLWTAYISLTTVGYGDFSAKTWQGRTATVMVTFFGIGCLAMFAGGVVENIMERRLRKMRGEIEFKGESHIVIINVPSYDEIIELLKELDSCKEYMGFPRVLIASSLPGNDAELPGMIMKNIDSFIKGMPSSMDTLKRANLQKAKACILVSNMSEPSLDDVNTMTAGIIEKNWPHIITVLDCVRKDTIENLDHFGIDGGVNSMSLQMGLLIQELKGPGTFNVYSQLSSNGWGQQIYITKETYSSWDGSFQDMTMGLLKKAIIKLEFPVTIMGIYKNGGKSVELNLSNDYKVDENDKIIYMAEKQFPWLNESAEITRLCKEI